MGDNKEPGIFKRWLPKLRNRNQLAINPPQTLTPQQLNEQSLATIANSLDRISNYIANGGLVELLSSNAKAGIAQGILNGLAAHDGRKSLDAQLAPQNIIEIAHLVDGVFEKFQERAKARAAGDLDPELKNGEEAYQKWLDENKK
jgi:hypothetical protein